MTSKVPGTPAYESSVLSNFKRRPRQPSILQMMQAEDGALDLDDDNDDDFLGGLSPGDESTPLNFARGKSLIARRNTPSRPGSLSPASSTASRKRKRDHEKFQVPGSPSDIVENTQNSLPCSDAPDNDNDSSDNLSLTRGHAYMFGHQTMAAPLSSSPVVTPGHTVTPLGPNHSAPQTTEEAKESTGQVHHSTIPISTESLQDKVLPRRRQRQRRHRNPGDFEVPSDEDGYVDAEVDDDELSYVPAKVSKSQRKPLNRSRPVAEMRAKSKLASRKKPPIHGKAGVDKENREGDMPSDSIDSNPAARFTSEELKAQAMKFAEVDKWQLEFEDVAMSGSQADSSGDL